MVYNFDEIIDRRGSNCVKWDRGKADVLPMWVADMDFKAAEPIIEAVKTRADNGIFGYTLHSEAYYNAIINWWNRRHNWQLEKEWILYCQGVVPSMAFIIDALTEPGDKVILQSPVYYPFYRVITNNGCEVVNNPLDLKGEKYEIDFESFEKLAADPKVKLLLFCNPQNPGGRVWSKDELIKLGDICVANNVLVLSDEIHCDLIFKGYKHIPFASIKPEFAMNTVTCTAPTKTFNIAGLQVSNVIIPNKILRDKVIRSFAINEVEEPNAFSVDALIAAYDKSEEWLSQMLDYVQGNLDYLLSFFENNLPSLKVMKPEATYLVWVDCRALGLTSKELTTRLTNHGKVWFNDGKTFGDNGDGYVRINIACPRSYVEEGLKRLKAEVDEILEN